MPSDEARRGVRRSRVLAIVVYAFPEYKVEREPGWDEALRVIDPQAHKVYEIGLSGELLTDRDVTEAQVEEYARSAAALAKRNPGRAIRIRLDGVGIAEAEG